MFSDLIRSFRDEGRAVMLVDHNVKSVAALVDRVLAMYLGEEIVTGKRRYLIEALALDIAKGLCQTFPQVRRAKITVRKPNAPVAGVLDHVEVTVVWPN